MLPSKSTPTMKTITGLKILAAVTLLVLIVTCAKPPKKKESIAPEDFPYVACNCATACLNDEGVMIVNTLITAHRGRF